VIVHQETLHLRVRKLEGIVLVHVALEKNLNTVVVQFSTPWKKCIIKGLG
jgi:tRNA G46 methylase TrmB